MTEFGSALEAIGFEDLFTEADLARALRYAIADEYEAIQIYSQISEAMQDLRMRAVIDDIVGEEKKHASQFWDLLSRIDPDEHRQWDKAVEVNRRRMGLSSEQARQELERRRRGLGRMTQQSPPTVHEGSTMFGPHGLADIGTQGDGLSLYLKGIEFPIDKNDLVAMAQQNQAPDHILSVLRQLPDRRYDQAAMVTEEAEKLK